MLTEQTKKRYAREAFRAAVQLKAYEAAKKYSTVDEPMSVGEFDWKNKSFSLSVDTIKTSTMAKLVEEFGDFLVSVGWLYREDAVITFDIKIPEDWE